MLAALACFVPVRFELIPLSGVVGIFVDLLSVIGIAVILGLMSFGFFGLKVAKVVAVVAAVVSAPLVIGFLHDYATLSASLVAYAVSTVVCWAMSVRGGAKFDFALIAKRTGDFDETEEESSSLEPTTVGDPR